MRFFTKVDQTEVYI